MSEDFAVRDNVEATDVEERNNHAVFHCAFCQIVTQFMSPSTSRCWPLHLNNLLSSLELHRSLRSTRFLTWKIFIIFQVVVVGRIYSITPSLPVRHLEIRGEGAPISKGREYVSENLH